jgi:Fe-S-cluster-containing dehydrogenase component/DMSO reductase anchor subunit
LRQFSFLFDLNRCTGCGACVVACNMENVEKQELNWREIYTFNETRHPLLPLFNISMACNHCLKPACMANCPASAYSKDPVTGAVSLNTDHCLGCKYCTWACPYDAPRFNNSRGVIEKCDFCAERLKNDEAPACVCACPTNALRLGEYEEEKKENEKREEREEIEEKIDGFTQSDIQPAIRFTPLRQKQAPESTAPPSKHSIQDLFASSQNIPAPKISLKSEWTLLAFTYIAFILVAVFTAAVTIGIPPILTGPGSFGFLGAGAVAMGLSTIHLGQKKRAYRAIFNIKSSWLSREILLFSTFLGLSFIYLQFFSHRVILGWFAMIIGYSSLFAVDRLYQVAIQVGPLNFHSANTLFTGLYLAGILTGNIPVLAGAGLIKLSLYIYRKVTFKRKFKKTRIRLSTIRLGLGFILPLWLVLQDPVLDWSRNIESLYGLLIFSVLVGELIDRTEFYAELDIITPRKQMLIDLEKHLNLS